MVEEFEHWVSANEQYFKDHAVRVDFTRRDSPSPAAVATLESKSLIASIAVWKTGACDIHVLSFETGGPVFVERYDLASFDKLKPMLEEVLKRFASQ